jgi:hypothetical protein
VWVFEVATLPIAGQGVTGAQIGLTSNVRVLATGAGDREEQD